MLVPAQGRVSRMQLRSPEPRFGMCLSRQATRLCPWHSHHLRCLQFCKARCSQAQRVCRVSRLLVAEIKDTLLMAPYSGGCESRAWSFQNSGLCLGCHWEMSSSTPPPTCTLLAEELSKDIPLAHTFSCFFEHWDPICSAASNAT